MQEQAAPSFAERLRTFIPALLLSGLFTLAIIRLDFESGSPLRYVLPVTCALFAFTYWLPKRFSFFAMSAASLLACIFFLGIYNTAALAFIIACYVSVFYIFKKTTFRIVAGLLMTALLAFLRMGVAKLPVLPLAAPVAGSMIMFRFVLMLYEHHYSKPQSTWMQKFCYLLLPPALAFPLFPIIDYKAFLNNHRPQDERVIRTGLARIAAGLIFMMIYRICYLYFIPGYVEVHDALTAFGYTMGNYLYVLNVLGILWMSAGFLGLLGFDLPQVFNYIFLVDSFRDVWRRINVYWRDFVVKLVYYPLYFRFRKKTKHAILLTSLITLTTSAILHGWQWFWIQGTMAVHTTGIIFWSILGLVISINLSVQKGDLPAAPTPRSVFSRCLRITGMILFMCFMWSLWNSSTPGEWVNVMQYYGKGTWLQWTIITGCIVATPFIVWLFLRLPEKPPGYHFLNRPYHGALLLGVSLLLLLPTFNAITSRLPKRVYGFMNMISTSRLSAVDESSATENYYNRMLASDGLGSRPWEMHTPGGAAKSGLDEACIRREDILVRELIPNKVTVLDGWTIATNSYGMRDKEYSLAKPEGVYRIAILGASYEMGSGVAQDSIFEAVTETMLNNTHGLGDIEILNFSVGGYHLPQQVWVAEHKIARFQPDLVLCFVHPADAARTSHYMASLIRNGTDLVYPELYAIKKESGAEQRMEERVLVNRLYPYSDTIASWSISRMRRAAYDMQAKFGVVYIPSFTKVNDVNFYRNLCMIPKKEEYWLPPRPLFIDMADIFAGREEQYRLVNDPSHPNARGHKVIAEELASRLAGFIRLHH